MRRYLILFLLLCLFPSAHAEDALFTRRDGDPSYDAAQAIRIDLLGDTATATSASVRIEGQTVSITEEATYLITGTLTDGMLLVDAPKAKLQLVFAGVDITSATSAPLYIREADKVFLTLADGTANALANGGSFEAVDDSNIDAAIFSKQDLTINGSGSLTVTSPAGHGIVSKDDLVLTGGTCTVTSASHGLAANDSIRISGADITVTAGKDGLQTEEENGFVHIASGTLAINAQGDGISAGTTLEIAGGALDILAGGGSVNGTKRASDDWGRFGGHRGRPREEERQVTDDAAVSMKGLKSGGNMTISGGEITINAADDALHSNASAAISGGSFSLASGDDAIHAEETLAVSGGSILITESYEGLEALHIAISGGEIALTASDDGLNAAGGTDSSGFTGGRDGRFGGPRGGNSDGTIVISGGVVRIQASGDGIDANGSLTISGGHTTVMGPTQGDTSVLDYDLTGEISGGTFIGTGSAMMAQSLQSGDQGVIAVSVGRQSANSAILITDAYGLKVLEHTPTLPYQIMIYSAPEIVSGETYTLTIGELTGNIQAD